MDWNKTEKVKAWDMRHETWGALITTMKHASQFTKMNVHATLNYLSTMICLPNPKLDSHKWIINWAMTINVHVYTTISSHYYKQFN